MHNGLGFVAAVLVLSSAASAALPPKEDPVGLVLSPGGSQVLRADTETAIAARAGDLIFPGDGLKTGAAAVSFLFCPAKTVDTLSPAGEVRFDAKALKVKSGKISEQPARACALPQTLRIAVASQQHYGVTMTRGTGTLDNPPVPRDKWPPEVLAQVAPLDAALAAGPQDPAVLIAMAGVFEKHNLPGNALEQYTKLRAQWPDAVWIKSKVFELEEAAAAQATAVAAAGPGGKTYALLVGISKYSKPELSLQFAHADATVFGKLLTSPRGGGLPADQILTLTDEKATTAAVRNGFHDFLDRRAGKQDTVILLFAGHGTVEVPGSRSAFILTYDSDPQDLASTALPMAELQLMFEKQLKKVGRVLLFVDVCKAGVIGSIQSTTISADVQRLGEVEGDLFGLLGSRPKEVSLEGPQFGGGHGSFSYFVMKGLGGAADSNKDGAVDADELIRYVINQVPAATNNKQHPREFGSFDNTMRLSDLGKPGIDLASGRQRVRGPLVYLASASPGWVPMEQDATVDATNQQRIALEDRAQEVLLRYLAGDQKPPTREDYANGARYMEEARKLTRESLFLEARQRFFEGRALLFDKQHFADAAGLLEQSVRLDPGAAYAYNALGIAYLEQAQFEKAIPAFRDAARRARHWSYPLHNLALAYVESGANRQAIAAYQEAIRLTPKFAYLPYNLGLLYQRLNRTKDAEDSYRKAIALAPDSPEAYNAMGTLKAAQRKHAQAEKWYRDAISRNQSMLPARHNLALLLAVDRARKAEAIALWDEILRQSPDYLPALIGLAENSEGAAAIGSYRRVVALKPEYTAARLALADLLKAGDPAGALEQLREASRLDAGNASIFEQIGDLEAAARRVTEARAAYQRALELASTRAVRKRLSEKLRR